MAQNLGQTPRAIVVLNGQVVPAQEIDITKTKANEASTAKITIDLEYLDCSVFLQKKQVFCEIWLGYIDERFETISLENLIKDRLYERHLFKRFEGIVDQPEFTIGFKDTVILNC